MRFVNILDNNFKNVKEGLLIVYIYGIYCISSYWGIWDDLIVIVKMLIKMLLYFRGKGNFGLIFLIDKDVICLCIVLEINLMWIKRREGNLLFNNFDG